MMDGSLRASSDSPVAASATDDLGPRRYLIDRLLRTTSGVDNTNASLRSEIDTIFVSGLRKGQLPAADQSYLASLVAAKTGASPADSAQRVGDAYVQAQQEADNVRKALAHSMYWTFLALLVGAFSASFAATIGGRERDHVAAI
jgi:hypothetical protein